VGYPEGIKAWKFWDPVNKKIIISSHAVFDERYFPDSPTTIHALDDLAPPPIKQQVVLHQGGDSEDGDEPPPVIHPNPQPIPQPDPPAVEEENDPLNMLPGILPDEPDRPPQPNPRRQNLNETKLRQQQSNPIPPPVAAPAPASAPSEPPSDDELNIRSDDEAEANLAMKQGMEYVFATQIDDAAQVDDYLTLDEALEYAFQTCATANAFKTSSHDNEPRTFKEAMQRPDESAMWYKAAVKEIQALVENGTFELVQLSWQKSYR
jgi:hypothetical protein